LIPLARLILVRAALYGPLGRVNLRLALDTGSTRTVVDPARLDAIGISSDARSIPLRITTAGGTSNAHLVTIPRLQTLGIERIDIPVARYRLPSNAAFDGLLGLDFFRDTRLTIDFQTGTIAIER
jgi:predicted aspartyl protease